MSGDTPGKAPPSSRSRSAHAPPRVARPRWRYGRLIAALLVVPLAAGAGCTTSRLRESTISVASTLTELQYRMVLDNLAMMSRHPQALPWGVKLDSGTVQVNDQIGAEAGLLSLTWQKVYDAVEGRAEILPQFQTTQKWDVVPVTDPKELRDLQAAYRRALGKDIEEALLDDIDIPQEWFGQGQAGDVPTDALYVGRYKNQRVWVAEAFREPSGALAGAAEGQQEQEDDEHEGAPAERRPCPAAGTEPGEDGGDHRQPAFQSSIRA